jgi:hypothetical protein
MRKTIVAIVMATSAVLVGSLITACDPSEMGVHPETRSVVRKGQDASGPYVVCRSSWTDGSGTPQHKDQKKEVSAASYANTSIGDSC